MNPITLIELDSINSTNEYLKKLTVEEEMHEGTVVLTREQLSGKGQSGNFWESEKGMNLTFSMLWMPKIQADQMFLISKAVSLGIIDALSQYNKEFKIKWPNDIYYQNKKLAGILIENQIMGNKLGYSIIGIGINVNQKVFKSSAPNPISLNKIIGSDINLHDLFKTLIEQISIWHELLSDGSYDEINKQYCKHIYKCQGYHTFITNGKSIHAKIIGVANDGELLLKTSKGEKLGFYFKEIEFEVTE